jgi:hypothetical protein
MFAELQSYKNRYGDCDVPSQWEQNPKLASWVTRQRALQRRGQLSPQRKAQLDALGFDWCPKKGPKRRGER